MHMLITILLLLAGIIALLLIFALISRKEYHIQREIIIHAPLAKVFDFVKQLKNQDQFNKWVMMDPGMKREFRGIDGTVGFIYGWNGNKKAGEGEQEIISMTEGKSIETEIRFVRPIPSIAYANMMAEAVNGEQTKVIWSNAGNMKYPMNIMVSMVSQMLGKDMDISLGNIKTILEK